MKKIKYDTSVCHLVRGWVLGVRLYGLGSEVLEKLGACTKGALECILKEMASGKR